MGFVRFSVIFVMPPVGAYVPFVFFLGARPAIFAGAQLIKFLQNRL
jgi:hypothetical protein